VKNNTASKLAQVPAGYLLVGVDPHKKRHATVIIDQGAIIQRKLMFANSRAGFQEMLQKLQAEVKRSNAGGMMLAIEAGSHYWRNLVYFLEAQKIPFRLVSPFTLKRRREGEDLNRRKNDYRDAEMAAELLRTGKFMNTRLLYGAYAEVRASYQSYQRLVKENTRQINLLKSLLDGVFPEFTTVFKDLRGKTALAVLNTCVIPHCIVQLEFTSFLERVRNHFGGRALKTRMLRELYQRAQESIGIREGAVAVAKEIQLLVQRLKLNLEQIAILVGQIRSLVDGLPESVYLLSVPGLGYLTAAGIIAGLGRIEDYANSGQLIKMAGTNPTQKESGGKSSSHTPMSKQGRADLRGGLWPAAVSILRYNTDFKAWATAKRERPAQSHPLHKREVIGATINRLLRVVFALVKKQTYYQSNYGLAIEAT
jgi:transposase